MSKRSRSKANIPIHRESLFWIMSPVSRLLSKQPILPSLPRIHESITQNKPNFRSAKTNTTSFPPKIYTNIPLRPAPKNKPKQSQSPNAIRHQGPLRGDTQHAIRKTNPNKPNSPPQYATRCTLYAIRNTQYENRASSIENLPAVYITRTR